jgi:hypothetical protein
MAKPPRLLNTGWRTIQAAGLVVVQPDHRQEHQARSYGELTTAPLLSTYVFRGALEIVTA